jgi:hypothetical protein
VSDIGRFHDRYTITNAAGAARNPPAWCLLRYPNYELNWGRRAWSKCSHRMLYLFISPRNLCMASIPISPSMHLNMCSISKVSSYLVPKKNLRHKRTGHYLAGLFSFTDYGSTCGKRGIKTIRKTIGVLLMKVKPSQYCFYSISRNCCTSCLADCGRAFATLLRFDLASSHSAGSEEY